MGPSCSVEDSRDSTLLALVELSWRQLFDRWIGLAGGLKNRQTNENKNSRSLALVIFLGTFYLLYHLLHINLNDKLGHIS